MSGLVYVLIIYQGKTTILDKDIVSNYGITGVITLKLAEQIPEQKKNIPGEMVSREENMVC